MSDKLRIFAKVLHKNGTERVESLTVKEKDSEVISDDEIAMMFMFACSKADAKVIGKIESEYV